MAKLIEDRLPKDCIYEKQTMPPKVNTGKSELDTKAHDELTMDSWIVIFRAIPMSVGFF